MAILNYTETLATLNSYINATGSDFLKIVFGPDAKGAGHIITHGKDYTPDYGVETGLRGFVPQNEGTLASTYLRGDGWQSFWSGKIDGNPVDDDKTLITAYSVKQLINQSYVSQQAMRYKGVINVSNKTVTSSTTNASGFPTSCEVGDTYKVVGEGTLAGQAVSTGDMLICIAASDAAANDASHWTVVQDNVEAVVSHSINGTAFQLYTADTNGTSFSIYAPTSSGKTGQILGATTNGTPTWIDPTTITAGAVQSGLSGGSGITIKTSGNTIKAYDGSTAMTVNLDVATESTIGGIFLDNGNGVGYGTSSDKKTMSITDDGLLYLTPQNIYNALGFKPGNDTGSVGKFVAAAGATDLVNATTVKANPFLNIITADDQTVLASFQVKQGDGISVNSVANSAAIQISLNLAGVQGETDSVLGGIKVWKNNTNYTVAPHISTIAANVTGTVYDSKYYGVEVDKNGAAFVNVPWISNIFNDENAPDGKGLVAAQVAANTSAQRAVANTYFLGSDAKWYQLPAEAFGGSWRNVKVNGIEMLDTTATNLTAGTTGLALDIIAQQFLADGVTKNKAAVEAVKSAGNYTGQINITATWRDILVPNACGATPASIGDDSIEFSDSRETSGIFFHAKSTNGKTTMVAEIGWYNLDSQTYEVLDSDSI